MKVNICGIPHTVKFLEDNFDIDCHFAMIDYKKAEIRVNKFMKQDIKGEAICHEMLHGMLVHLGYNDLSADEQFVQALSNAIYQGFLIKNFE